MRGFSRYLPRVWKLSETRLSPHTLRGVRAYEKLPFSIVEAIWRSGKKKQKTYHKGNVWLYMGSYRRNHAITEAMSGMLKLDVGNPMPNEKSSP